GAPADRSAAPAAEDLLGPGGGRSGRRPPATLARRGGAPRRADPARGGAADRTAGAVAARSAGALPQDRAGRLAGDHVARRPQPPGAADDRGGRTADAATGARRGRRAGAGRTAAGRVAGVLTHAILNASASCRAPMRSSAT